MPNPVRFPSGISTANKNTTLFDLPQADPTKYITYWDDFTQGQITSTDWTATLTGTTPTYALTDAHGGAILLTTTGAENDGLNLQKKGELWLPNSGKKFWFKTRFQISDATESDFVVGLAVTDTTLLGAAAGDGVTDGVFFQKDDGATTVSFYCQKNTTTGQTSASLGAITAATDTTYGCYYDGARYITVFINDAKYTTVDLSSDPTAYLPDTELAVSLAFLTGAAAVKTMQVDYIYFCAER